MLIDPEGHEVSALLPRLAPARAGVVVEIGCGDGRVTRRYSSQVRSVIASDPDGAGIAAFRASGLPPNVDVRSVSVFELDLPDASADVVLLSWAL